MSPEAELTLQVMGIIIFSPFVIAVGIAYDNFKRGC